MLEVKNLNKKFGEVHAVKNLNFQIRKGEIFGFLGPNGAGKTTTMRMVTCLIPPSSGSIAIDGSE
jgi:ABC-2 type transport system ATP-binding protein